MSLSPEQAKRVAAQGGKVGYTLDGDLVEVGTGFTVDGDLLKESFPGSNRGPNGERLLVYRASDLFIVNPNDPEF